ncbi:MAG: (2Fe-2S)-binding protein [Nitratireductor sp.]
MKAVSPFRHLEEGDVLVRVVFEGSEYRLRKGGNLAAELLAAGIVAIRKTVVSAAPRNPYCMMGACHDCLVSIDGVTRQACMVEVQEDMTVSMPPQRENGNA